MKIFMMKSAPKIFHVIEFFRFPGGGTKINNLGNIFSKIALRGGELKINLT